MHVFIYVSPMYMACSTRLIASSVSKTEGQQIEDIFKIVRD